MPDERATAGPALVSACLLGERCRYNAVALENEAMARLAREGRLVPVCPEVAGGLPTPREPANIVGPGRADGSPASGEDVLDGRARVLTASGRDVTDAFLAGAREAARVALAQGVRRAYLKTRSPSCGAGALRNRAGGLDAGNGVTAALLLRLGIEVVPVDAAPGAPRAHP